MRQRRAKRWIAMSYGTILFSSEGISGAEKDSNITQTQWVEIGLMQNNARKQRKILNFAEN